MSSGFFSIGLSGLAVAQLNLLTTEHNIVNANTDGYTRQRVLQSANVGVMAGTGAIGQGVTAVTTERLYDRFVTAQMNTAQTETSSLKAYYGQISQIDAMLADSSAGLSPALQSFFAGVQQVAANPSLLPARQSMISSAQTMVSRFQSMSARLDDLGVQVNDRITNAVSEVNDFAAQIAKLNGGIRNAEAGYGQPANDLRDQRDQLVLEINKRIKVTTTSNADGTYNLFVGSGQQLVVGVTVVELTAEGSKADASKIVIGLKVPGGSQELPDSLIVGGELGGLVAFRNEGLEPAANEIGRSAASLALTFNAQHALGQDLMGSIAGDSGFVGQFFTIPNPKIIANAENTGSGAISASFAAPTAPGAPNFSGNFSTNLTNSSYQIQFGAAGAYTITRLSDNVQVQTGSGAGSVTFDGVTLAIGTVGASGDKFVIKPVNELAKDIAINTRIAADPRLVAAGAPVAVKPTISNTGTMVMSQGVVGVGYTAPSPAITLNTTATGLTGLSVPWTATYSDGSSVSSTIAVPLAEIAKTNGGAILASISFNNMAFNVTGSPALNDTFTIQKNTGGVQDSRNAILFAKLQTQNTTVGGTATYQSSYSRLVADNGVRTREAKVQLDARTAVLAQSQASRDSLSAVNLDEEAANMLKFQQAYQASSKILAIGSKLFDSILQIG